MICRVLGYRFFVVAIFVSKFELSLQHTWSDGSNQHDLSAGSDETFSAVVNDNYLNSILRIWNYSKVRLRQPTSAPTLDWPSLSPSASPSFATESPSFPPSTIYLSQLPSHIPSTTPSFGPTSSPTIGTTFKDTLTAYPSDKPTPSPSEIPSDSPSGYPIDTPSTLPTSPPTTIPSNIPSAIPSTLPSYIPSAIPSENPSTSLPSQIPSESPSDLLPFCEEEMEIMLFGVFGKDGIDFRFGLWIDITREFLSTFFSLKKKGLTPKKN
mmetsp:Transcript_25777/g.59343  ORF Transcript_25777/g.59343 Transcript_25777/m.59343 type:complete len:267 (+) Transcript_25777:147-947(+)